MQRLVQVFCLGVIAALPLHASAQMANLKCLDKPYKWKKEIALDQSIPELTAPEGADILFEKQRVSFLRSKPELLSIVFERHVVFRFGTREAISKHTKFQLPESFDPPTDYQDVAIEDRDSIPRPFYFDVSLVRFAGRVIGPPERVHDIEANGDLTYQRKKTGTRFLRAATYNLELPGVAPGDTVELIYKYIVPFEENWFRFNSSKHYFHGDLFKHHYQLQVDATITQGLNLRGAPADSTALTRKKRYAYWFLDDLKACMDEVNGRPHADLPYVVYGTLAGTDFYQHGHLVSVGLGGVPFAFSNIDYWVDLLRRREAVALDYRRLARKKIPMGQQLKVRTWLGTFGGVERSPLEKALSVHDRIARDFTFQWDDAWYDGRDQSLVKHGTLLEEKTLREIGRYSQYSKLFSELQLKYQTVYVQDSRVGKLTPMELTDLYENEYLFMLRHVEGAFFMHPKRARGGYLVNEQPFYWEGTTGLVGDLDKLWSNNRKMVELTELPQLNAITNSRVTGVDITIGEGGSANVDADILLNGQFSTLTRNAYIYGERDSTVMEKYGDLYLHDLNEHSWQLINGPSSAAPYTTELAVTGGSVDLIEQQDSLKFTVNLTDFFPFLIPEGFTATGRDIPFYWDFGQQDRYRVDLKFARPVRVEERSLGYGSKELGAQLFSEVKMRNDSTVSVSAVLLVSKERVPVSEAKQLEELFQHIFAQNEFKLEVAWKEKLED